MHVDEAIKINCPFTACMCDGSACMMWEAHDAVNGHCLVRLALQRIIGGWNE